MLLPLNSSLGCFNGDWKMSFFIILRISFKTRKIKTQKFYRYFQSLDKGRRERLCIGTCRGYFHKLQERSKLPSWVAVAGIFTTVISLKFQTFSEHFHSALPPSAHILGAMKEWFGWGETEETWRARNFPGQYLFSLRRIIFLYSSTSSAGEALGQS